MRWILDKSFIRTNYARVNAFRSDTDSIPATVVEFRGDGANEAATEYAAWKNGTGSDLGDAGNVALSQSYGKVSQLLDRLESYNLDSEPTALKDMVEWRELRRLLAEPGTAEGVCVK